MSQQYTLFSSFDAGVLGVTNNEITTEIDDQTPKYVGEISARNTMTITIEPSTSMIRNAGKIMLFGPAWYSRYDNGNLLEQYAYENAFRCSSPRVGTMISYMMVLSTPDRNYFVL